MMFWRNIGSGKEIHLFPGSVCVRCQLSVKGQEMTVWGHPGVGATVPAQHFTLESAEASGLDLGICLHFHG